jgi:adenylate cyclase
MTMIKKHTTESHFTGNMEGTALFVDIANFLSITDVLNPKETSTFILSVMEPLSECIADYGGYVCQVQGDAILAVFGYGETGANHAIKAVDCALEIVRLIDILNPVRINNVHVPLSGCIGISSGELYSCSINVAGRKEYTVLGKTVNLASRYQKMNKYYHTKILIDETVFTYIKKHVLTRRLDKIEIDGCSHSVQIYEVLFSKAENEHQPIRKNAHYLEGLTKYLQGNWNAALDCFSRIAEEEKGYRMAERCRQRIAFYDFIEKEKNFKT